MENKKQNKDPDEKEKAVSNTKPQMAPQGNSKENQPNA